MVSVFTALPITLTVTYHVFHLEIQRTGTLQNVDVMGNCLEDIYSILS